MERSVIRERPFPDYATLHPGYKIRTTAHFTAANPMVDDAVVEFMSIVAISKG
jgi:hypothetical protein